MRIPVIPGIAGGALLCILAGAAAHAHAFLDRAEPRVGSSVPSAPRQLSLWFTQDLEPAFSTVEVQNSAGARVDQGKPRIGPGNVMRVGLKPLPPGSYRVLWHALSVDTHTTEGSFTFRVGAQ
jgi:methionine-rich copper-binding protein CopC